MTYDNLTPRELIEFENQKIQQDLKIQDSKLITTGPISIFSNTMANILFDAKLYYQYITKEMNVATAEDSSSMMFHATVYNYVPKMALAANAMGYLVIPQPTINDDQQWSLTLKKFSNIILNDQYFRINGQIDLYYDNVNGMTGVFADSRSQRPLKISTYTDSGIMYYMILIEDEILEQLERQLKKFIIPNYSIGENITFSVDIETGQKINTLKFYLNSFTNPTFDIEQLETIAIDLITTTYDLTEFKAQLFKLNASSFDDVVYVKYNDNYNGFTFTIGNGIYGRKLELNDEIIVLMETTSGQAGNVKAAESEFRDIDTTIVNVSTGATDAFYSSNIKFIMNSSAHGGTDEDSVEAMRFNILKKITERESLLTPLDFMKFFGESNSLAIAIAKQIQTNSINTIIYKEFRDYYRKFVVSTYTDHVVDDTIVSDKYTINYTNTYGPDNKEFISPFIYINRNNRIFSYYLIDSLDINLSLIKQVSAFQLAPKLEIKWDETNEIFYFQGSELSTTDGGGTVTYYSYNIISSIGTYVLNQSNSYRQDIDTTYLYLNKFLLDEFAIDSVNITEDSTSATVHWYNVSYKINSMIRVQEHKLYRYDVDNDGDDEDIVLYCPFIEKEYYDSVIKTEEYQRDYFIEFFRVKTAYDNMLVPYNISINQVFPDTEEVNPILLDYLIDNENSIVQASYPIVYSIIYDSMQMSKNGLTLSDIDTAIRLYIIDYMSSSEGININFRRTEIIKGIKNLYPDIVLEVTDVSPKTLVIEDFDKILDKYEPASAWEALNLHPTYFNFDYDNMDLQYIKI